jgi:type II secretory pathway pseudopilin PulG
MRSPEPTRRCKPSEEGYILLAVIFMLAILVIALAVAAPVVRKDIQRDREIETMHRGKQYVRGIKMYYKKFGAYPPTVDALVNTNQIRFLRKKYIDPTTGKDEWKIIRFGQNKTQTMGFFGQPIGGGMLAGAGLGANGLSPSTGMFNSPPGSNSTSGAANNGSTSSSGTDPAAANGTPATPGAGTSGTSGSSTDPNSAGSSSAFGNGTGQTGQTFGGGGIIGVSPNSPKQSILVYKKKNHYNEWEFFYDPIADQMMQGGNTGIIGQPAGSMGGSPGIGSPGGGGPGIGGSPGFGGTPPGGNPPGGSPTTPTPQQPQ